MFDENIFDSKRINDEAVSLKRQGKYKKALKKWQELIDKHQSTYNLNTAYYGMGKIYMIIGDREKAKERFLEATKLILENWDYFTERLFNDINMLFNLLVNHLYHLGFSLKKYNENEEIEYIKSLKNTPYDQNTINFNEKVKEALKYLQEVKKMSYKELDIIKKLIG